MRPRTTVGVVCLITASALFAACQPSQPVDAAANEAAALKLEAQQPVQKQAAAKAVQVKKAVAKAAPTKAVATNTAPATAARSRAIAADVTPANTPVMESRALAPKQEPEIVTTISGCLERDGGTFRLTDTDGQNAPKSRSWKSGFIKKGSASIDVIDTANRLKLASHAGHRVSVTGTLVDREMRARSVRPTSERCD